MPNPVLNDEVLTLADLVAQIGKHRSEIRRVRMRDGAG
jgi:hypothetical protein